MSKQAIRHLGLGSALVVVAFGACANDPVYIDPDDGIVAGLETDAMGDPVPGKASFLLPIHTERASDVTDREKLQMDVTTKYGADVVVPYVRVGNLEVSVEWTIENRSDKDGQAQIEINGANQFYDYDPKMVILSTSDEAPKTPGLSGDVPIDVPAGTIVNGLFTEDDMRETSIDLDQITRGRVNPFRARLTISKNVDHFAQLTEVTFVDDGEGGMEAAPQMETGVVFPREAFAQMLRFDFVFSADQEMVLRYDVRVRDVRGNVLHDKLRSAPTAELQYMDPYTSENGFYAPAPPAPGA
ncbi:MAG TPA: hypothetical protein VGM90_26400 [Kofleriaceae bacterium]|jgi:hypothetical protein